MTAQPDHGRVGTSRIRYHPGNVFMSVGLLFRVLIYFLLAVIAAALLGSVIQSQFNLGAISALGAEVPVALWLTTTLQDLAGFAPLYAGIVAVALLPALIAAALVSHWCVPASAQGLQAVVYAVAGAVGLFVAFQLADAFAPMPTLIAATRTAGGTLAMMASGALGGWLFARLVMLGRPAS